ncbi:MAG: protein kinase [Lachnospiraceae bacterium]|nr:protein kinase [Lachnospiraceae bacterium]
MEYQTICTIKESEKATVELAAVELLVGPVIVKRLKGGKPEIYRLLAMQKNPHIPQIYVVEETEEELLIAEEYVDGENLGEYLQKNLLSDEEKITLALQLCDAVGFLHALKPSVIHRDIKPSNIIITGKGELKLIDFDASRRYKETPSSSDTRLLGTVEYAPPEQFGYSQTDVRSDIYSMGVVFHEMRPAENKKLEELWEAIAEKCTSFDPKNRYQNVAELKRELEKLSAWKKKRKKKQVAWIAGIITVCIAGAVLFPFLNKHRPAEETKGTAPTGMPMPTDMPVTEPTQSPTPTVESAPSPTLTPTLSPVPTSTPVPTGVPELQNKVEEIVEDLKDQSLFIDTFYKGLDTFADYMQYSDLYVGEDVHYTDIVAWNLAEGRFFSVPQEYYYCENNVLHIKRRYLCEWNAGIYRLEIIYEDRATGRSSNLATHLQIFEGTDVAEDAQLFDNNYVKFYYEYQDCAYTILSNDIVGSFKNTGDYRLLENGRVIAFDTEFLLQKITPGESGVLKFELELEDGRKAPMVIEYCTGNPPFVK